MTVHETRYTLEDAIILAATAHRGQRYPSPGGEPYVLHPLRVMARLETEHERIVAVLHDVVEDTACMLEDLRRRGYPDEVIAALDHLTQRPGEGYDAYIERLASHALARRVKLADLADNLANNRRLDLTAQTRARIERYERAHARLLALSSSVDTAPWPAIHRREADHREPRQGDDSWPHRPGITLPQP